MLTLESVETYYGQSQILFGMSLSVDAGQVVILIGVAPVKPAEFVIFRIGQSASGAEVESQ